MATVLEAWGDPEQAEASLMHARLEAALGTLAEVENVSIDHTTGGVDVVTRVSEDLSEAAHALRAARISGKVLDIVANLFSADELVLNHIRIDQPDSSGNRAELEAGLRKARERVLGLEARLRRIAEGAPVTAERARIAELAATAVELARDAQATLELAAEAKRRAARRRRERGTA